MYCLRVRALVISRIYNRDRTNQICRFAIGHDKIILNIETAPFATVKSVAFRVNSYRFISFTRETTFRFP